ncbi:tetratricopeptide repeat protein [Phytomonospora sp. NPDC050363]|uniref:tetratricopeptide repeat protein n=1 Tax=Phytomonospora sp. NPDC050363 TaxID=3155642 RepID=UPI00340C23CC
MSDDLAERRADALLDAGRPAEAREYAVQAVTTDPDNGGAWLSLAFALNKLGEHTEALAAAERAVVLWHDPAAAHLQRCDALLQLGRLEEALAAAREGVALRPGTWRTHFEFARSTLALHRRADSWHLLGEGRAAAAEAVRLDPGEPDAHRILAMIHGEFKDRAAARAVFEEAVRLDPNDANTWHAYGEFEYHADRDRIGAAHFARALRLDPHRRNTAGRLRELAVFTSWGPVRNLGIAGLVLTLFWLASLFGDDPIDHTSRVVFSAVAVLACWLQPAVRLLRTSPDVRRFGWNVLRGTWVVKGLAVATLALAVAAAVPGDVPGSFGYPVALIGAVTALVTRRRALL